MQLGILIEEMRREGYEMSLSPPTVVKSQGSSWVLVVLGPGRKLKVRPTRSNSQHLQRGRQWRPLHYPGISIGHPFQGPGAPISSDWLAEFHQGSLKDTSVVYRRSKRLELPQSPRHRDVSTLRGGW